MKPVKGARVRLIPLECSCVDCPAEGGGYDEYTLGADLEVGRIDVHHAHQNIGTRYAMRGCSEGFIDVVSLRQLSENEYGIRHVSSAHGSSCPLHKIPLTYTSRVVVLSEPTSDVPTQGSQVDASMSSTLARGGVSLPAGTPPRKLN